MKWATDIKVSTKKHTKWTQDKLQFLAKESLLISFTQTESLIYTFGLKFSVYPLKLNILLCCLIYQILNIKEGIQFYKKESASSSD